MVEKNWLNSFLNFTGTKAAGAYGYGFYRAVLNDFDFLDIGILDFLSSVVRVAYIVAEHRFFTAYFTFAWHDFLHKIKTTTKKTRVL